MNFLCDNHQQIVLQDMELAQQLWLGAFQNGINASENKDWGAAVSFFGTAYEIGMLRLQLERHSPSPNFTAEQAVSSGRCLANVMAELRENFSVETYLKEIFEILAGICLDRECSDIQRCEAFFHLQEFSNRLVVHFENQGRQKTGAEIAESFKNIDDLARADLIH